MAEAGAIPAIVLAGERAGGNALARAHGLGASVLIEVAGRSLIERVIDTLRASRSIAGGLVVGPHATVVENTPGLRALFARGDFRWQAPAAGPSASALAAAASLARHPLLLTAGDHALLEAATVDTFCAEAGACDADFVVGLVPHALVAARFPRSRRTLLKFSDGTYCGANLFLLRTAAGHLALALWQAVEQERKRPWRIAARLAPGALLRYLAGRLPVAEAFARLSETSGCRVAFVEVHAARAAVDVDSSADLALAETVLRDG